MRPKRLTCPECGYTTTIATRRSQIVCRGCSGTIDVRAAASAGKKQRSDDVVEVSDDEIEVVESPEQEEVELEVVDTPSTQQPVVAESTGPRQIDFDDIRQLAKPVLRHRVLRNFHAESEKVTPDMLIERLLDAVPVPKSGM